MLFPRAHPSNISTGEWEQVKGMMHMKAVRLTSADAVEQAILGGIGLLSFGVCSALLVYLFSLVIHPGQAERKERARSLKRFMLSDMGVYFLSLLMCDLITALGAVANVYWSTQFLIVHSTLCDLQGATNHFGMSGAAFWNLALAVQTFLLLVVRYQPPQFVKWVVLATGWAFAVLMTILGPVMNTSPFSFFGPNSAGCWLTSGSSNFRAWFFAIPYLAIGVLLTMGVLYLLIFLSLTGTLAKISDRITSHSGSDKVRATMTPASKRAHEVRRVAKKMLWFPIAYGVLSVPLAVSILLAANGKTLRHSVLIWPDALWILNGVADVFIFVVTRQHLLRVSSSPLSQTSGDLESHCVAMSVMKSTHVSPADEMPVYAPDSHTNHQSELYIYPNAEKELATGEEDHSVMPWTPPAFSNFETVQPVGGTEGGGGGGGGRNKKRSSGIERKARAEGSEDSAGLVGSSGTGVARSKSGKRVIQFSEKEDHIP